MVPSFKLLQKAFEVPLVEKFVSKFARRHLLNLDQSLYILSFY